MKSCDIYKNNNNTSDDGFLRSYEDGERFKKHPFFKKFPTALRLLLDYDDFDGNNPLGSKVQEQKKFILAYLICPLT